jgi:hypothetical protein
MASGVRTAAIRCTIIMGTPDDPRVERGKSETAVQLA